MSAPHPFAAAWRTRDLEAWMASLSEDVTLRSPILSRPFVGKAEARELYAALFEHLTDVVITHELSGDGVYAAFWRAEAAGRRVDGTDLLTADAEGRICEIAVYIRPLRGIGAFNRALGPVLAGRRGRWRGPLVRLLNGPLGLVFAAVDRGASRLVRG